MSHTVEGRAPRPSSRAGDSPALHPQAWIDSSNNHAAAVLVFRSGPVFLPAHLALCGWFRVVHAVLYRLESAQIGKHGFQVAVGEVGVDHDRHERVQRTRFDISAMHDLQKKRVIVIRDSTGRSEEIRAGNVPPRARKDSPTCKLQAGQVVATHLRSVTDRKSTRLNSS